MWARPFPFLGTVIVTVPHVSTAARLDNVEHAALKLRRGHGSPFGEGVNQVAVFASEFLEVQREYPILFTRGEDGALQGVAILGLERDENLFLEGNRWDANYLPALFARGPFLIGFSGSEPIIHVDLAHPRIAGEGEDGDPVFLAQGGSGPVLEAAMAALRAIHIGSVAAPVMTKLFDELGLGESVSMEVQLSDTAAINFDGYLAITSEQLAALDAEALGRLSAAGLLDVAIYAAASLGTMNHLAARKRRKDAGKA